MSTLALPLTTRPWYRQPRNLVPIVLVFLGALCLPFDVPVSSYFASRSYPRWLADIFSNAEPFGHAIGVGLVILAIVTLDQKSRKFWPALFAASIGSGLLTNVFKLCIARTRPRDFALNELTVWDTFERWFPLWHGGASSQSFPSAHAATATGFACLLAGLYPRAAWYFGLLATLVAIHRIQSCAHFMSDVCCGAALGWTVGNLCLDRIRHLIHDQSGNSTEGPLPATVRFDRTAA